MNLTPLAVSAAANPLPESMSVISVLPRCSTRYDAAPATAPTAFHFASLPSLPCAWEMTPQMNAIRKKNTNVNGAEETNAGSVRSYIMEPMPAANPPRTPPNNSAPSMHTTLPTFIIVGPAGVAIGPIFRKYVVTNTSAASTPTVAMSLTENFVFCIPHTSA